MAKSKNNSNFKASNGWFWQWWWRYNIGKSIRLHGEASEVNLVEAEEKKQLMRDAILAGGFHINNIFNMDETGLFYQSIPN